MVSPILNRLSVSPEELIFIQVGELYQIGVKQHRSALELLLPLMVLCPLLAEIQRLKPLAKSHGLDINVNWCKM